MKSARRFKFKQDVVAWVLSVIMACTAMVLLPLVARGAVGSVVWVQPGVITGGTVPGISSNGSVHGCLTFIGADGTRNTRLAGYAADGTPTYSRDFPFPPAQGTTAPACLLPSLQQTRPALVGEQYYLTDSDATGDNVYISAYTGATRIWTHAIESVHPTGTGTGTTIVDLQVGEDGRLYVLEYVNNGEYYLESVDPTTGGRIWRRTFTGSFFLPYLASRLWVTKIGISLTDAKVIQWISYDNQLLAQRTIPNTNNGSRLAHVDIAPDGTAYVGVVPEPVFDEPCPGFNGTVAALSPSSAADAPSWQFDFPPGPCQRLSEIRALPDGGALGVVPGPGGHGIDALVKVDSSSAARHQLAWRQPDSSLARAVNESEPSIDSGGHIMLTTRLPVPCQPSTDPQATCIAADVRVYSPLDGTLISDTPVPFQASDVSSATTTSGDSTAYLSLVLNSSLFKEAAVHIPDFGHPWPVSEIRAAYLGRQPPPLPGPPAPAQRYVALGDSFSSGEGAAALVNGKPQYLPGTDQPENRCHRSAVAYGPLKAKGSSIDNFQFHACSGSLIEDFFTSFSSNRSRQSRGTPANAAEGSQLSWLAEDTSLVTLTAGGNNANFEGVMEYCAKRFAFEPTCRTVWSLAVDSSINNMSIGTGKARDNLPDLYAAIRKAAPTATVLVLGYPRFFPRQPPTSCLTGVLSPSVMQPEFVRSDMVWINSEIAKLNKVIQQKAIAAGFRYVDTYNAFDRHELCNGKQVEWMTRFVLDTRPNTTTVSLKSRDRLQQSYHPNVLGQQQFWSLISGL